MRAVRTLRTLAGRRNTYEIIVGWRRGEAGKLSAPIIERRPATFTIEDRDIYEEVKSQYLRRCHNGEQEAAT